MPNISGIFSFHTSEFIFEKDFLIYCDNNLKIIADVTLTNRTELINKLGALSFKHDDCSDEHLILLAYKKWGENCVNHLVGDFAFAIWDEQDKKLFCSRDHFGASPLFYFQDKSKFIFGSEPNLILKLSESERELNRNKLVTFLIPEPHTYLTKQSWIKDIFPFPSGTSFSINSKEIRKKIYWKPNRKEVFKNRDNTDILEEFREMFFEIITARLRNNSNPVSLLSGGLDSSSIVSVMAKTLEKQNKSFDVFAGVLGNTNDKTFSDEKLYIDQFKNFPNLNINYITAPNLGPFSNLDIFFQRFDSPQITSRHYLYSTFQQNASSKGANVLFDGSFGEAGATFHGTGGFAELFTKFKWKQLLHELRLRSDIYGDSIKYNFRANTLNPILPQFLINFKKGNKTIESLIHKNHFFNKDFAQNLLKSIDVNVCLPQRISPDTQTNQLNEMKFIQQKVSEFPSNKFAHDSVEIRYPFLDKRLIEFTQSVPLHLKMKDGYYRYLIRVALDGILPKKIQWRTSKTPFSPDYVRRHNSQIENVKELLSEISPNDPICEILDIEKIKSWANLSVGDNERYTKGEILAREQIPQAIYLIYFLRTFKEFRS